MSMGRRIALACACWPLAAISQEHAEPIDWHLNFRPRYEYVDRSSKSQDASAVTLRTLAGIAVRPTQSLVARIEIIDVTQLTDDFNDTQNGNISYPVVADPDNTHLNELNLEYLSGGLSALVGRHSVRLNRTRFIGAQDFRQTMQVFDGAAVDFKANDRLGLYGAYFDRVTSVTGTRRDDDVGVVRADWSWSSGNSLLLSAYWQDKANAPAVATDTSYRIENFRWDGDQNAVSGARLNYTVEYARQRPFSDGALKVRADYSRAGAGLIWPKAFVRIDYEALGSDDGSYGFQTPLANNHAYLGWADQFVVTPDEGVRDWWTTFGGSVGPLRLVVEHHQMRSDYGDIDFGYETDAGATWMLREGLFGRLQLADYRNGDDPLNPRADTTKLWLTVVWVAR